MTCPICTSEHRREIDSEIIYGIDQQYDENRILRLVAEFCADKGILIRLDLDALKEHLRKHPLVGLIGAKDVRGADIIRLPSGERIDMTDTKGVLRQLLVVGFANALSDPGSITVKDMLRIAELLLRPDPNDGEKGELEELRAYLLGRMREKPPTQIDLTANPYAAPSNVGSTHDNRT